MRLLAAGVFLFKPAARLTRCRLEDLPDEMGEQSEQQEHECADPEQEVSGQLWGFDFFLVHSTKDTLRVSGWALPSFARPGSREPALNEVEGAAVPSWFCSHRRRR